MTAAIHPARSARLSMHDYHRRTKHHLDGYAKGPDTLDWDDQPDPFRDYGQHPCVQLPLTESGVRFANLAAGRPVPSAPLGRDSLGALLSCALAISSWKQQGAARWPVRCNPSSGNLHPTEAYLALPDRAELPAGLYHYRPQDHQLGRRCRYPAALADALFGELPRDGFLLGLSSVPWREAWKYGERAWRYCQLDLGHALGSIRYAAALLGWRVTGLAHLADAEVAALLGLDRTAEFEADEPEYPELLCLVSPVDTPPAAAYVLPQDLAIRLKALSWYGKANRLSTRHHYRWPLIDEAVRSAEKPRTALIIDPATPLPAPTPYRCDLPAPILIRRRRSAQAYDGGAALDKDDFFRLLDHALPRPGLPPWAERPARASLHLVLFVHRVAGLPKGVYVLPRRPDIASELQIAMRDAFQWQPVPECPDHLPLFHLVGADARRSAARLACQQAIAGDGAFSLAMLSEFERGLAIGPWGYRTLMREAGLLGQALYLGAEACDLQGTGIGCFFDDALHDLFGLQDQRYQVLYQFTVGKAVHDGRIRQQRPYPQLVD